MNKKERLDEIPKIAAVLRGEGWEIEAIINVKQWDGPHFCLLKIKGFGWVDRKKLTWYEMQDLVDKTTATPYTIFNYFFQYKDEKGDQVVDCVSSKHYEPANMEEEYQRLTNKDAKIMRLEKSSGLISSNGHPLEHETVRVW